jgi:type VI secretion system protein VasG
MGTPRRALFGKLNLSLFRAIESATAFAKLRGNPYVELVHWLHQLWQVSANDFQRIASHYGMDAAQLEKDFAVGSTISVTTLNWPSSGPGFSPA